MKQKTIHLSTRSTTTATNMYITVLQENLEKALQFVGKAISSKPQLPILANILLEVRGGKLQLSATNMETTNTIQLAVKVEKEGSITVPAKSFIEFIGSLAPEKIEITLDENTLRVKSGKAQASFVTISASEFPPLPKRVKKESFSFSKDLLTDVFLLVCLSAATDEGRPVLTGVSVSRKEGDIVFAATDGFRLSVVKKQVPFAFEESLVIPSRTLSEVSRAIKDGEGDSVDVFINKEKNQVSFVFAKAEKEIIARLIEGEFPNYKKIIPESHKTRVVFDREPLLQAVKTASIFARAAANVVRLAVQKSAIVISANAPAVGKNTVTVEAEIEGEEGEIAFNSRFLLDFLSNFTQEKVVFEMTGVLSPGVFKSEKDDSILHIIMPIRVQN